MKGNEKIALREDKLKNGKKLLRLYLAKFCS